MKTPKELDRIAFEEKLLSVTRYALALGLIVLLCLAVQKPLGKYWDMEFGDYGQSLKGGVK